MAAKCEDPVAETSKSERAGPEPVGGTDVQWEPLPPISPPPAHGDDSETDDCPRWDWNDSSDSDDSNRPQRDRLFTPTRLTTVSVTGGGGAQTAWART
jgi:hypothetical protein